MSDKEKKALKELTEIKELVEEDLKYKDYEVAATLDQIDLESLVIVLNIIEKQSKEIEELKEKCKEVVCIPEGTCFIIEPKDVDKKWEDKIKAKIEEYEEQKKDEPDAFLCKRVLQSLLEKE